MRTLEPVSMDAIDAAQKRIAPLALRTPLVRLNGDDAPAGIWLKLENLQPVGSFKVRGAGNALLQMDPRDLANGVWTVSAGNMAQAVAWCARRLKVACTAVVPDDAPENKLQAIRRLGGEMVSVPFADYQQIQIAHAYPGMKGVLIHPFADPNVMAGNGTLALEILDELADVDAIVVPYGGGGLSCGIASAIRARAPHVRVFASEVETGAPLAPSLAAGKPVTVHYRHSFVSGIGAPFIFPEMWALASQLLDGSIVTTLAQVTSAIKLVAERNRVIAEGAAATAIAAALSGQAGRGKIVCVVSGGNIDNETLAQIIQGCWIFNN
jgi:threonine dehydratase